MATDLDRRVEELASTQHNVFSVGQVLLLKGTRSAIDHRVRTGRWKVLGHGVLQLVGVDTSFRTRLQATLLGTRCTVVVSHRAAAALYAIPTFGEGLVEITALPGGFAQRPDVVAHRTNFLPDRHLRTVDGLRVTSPARTLCDLTAVTTGPERVSRATDAALRDGLVTPAGLEAVLSDLAGPGRRKTRTFAAIVLPRLRGYVPPESELEVRFLDLVREHGLPEPERQVEMSDLEGWIGRVDFLFRDARVVVETDGRRHHTTPTDLSVDAARDARLEASGWQVRRLTWEQVVHRAAQTADDLRFLLERGPVGAAGPNRGMDVTPCR